MSKQPLTSFISQSLFEKERTVELVSLVSILWINVIVFALNIMYFGKQTYRELYLLSMIVALLVSTWLILRKTVVPNKTWFYTIFTVVFLNMQFVTFPSNAVGSDLLVTLASIMLIYYIARVEATESKNGVFFSFGLIYGSIALQMTLSVETVVNRFEKLLEFVIVIALLQLSFIFLLSIKKTPISFVEILIPLSLSSILLRPVVSRTEITGLPSSSLLIWIVSGTMMVALFVLHKIRPNIVPSETVPPSIVGMLLLPEITRYSVEGRLISISSVSLFAVPSTIEKIIGVSIVSLESIAFFAGSLFLVGFYFHNRREDPLHRIALNSLLFLNLTYLLIELLILKSEEVSLVPILLLLQITAIVFIGLLENKTIVPISLFLAIFTLLGVYLDSNGTLSYLKGFLVIIFGTAMLAYSRSSRVNVAKYGIPLYFPSFLAILTFSEISSLPVALLDRNFLLFMTVIYTVIAGFMIPRHMVGLHSIALTTVIFLYSVTDFSTFEHSLFHPVDPQLLVLTAYVCYSATITFISSPGRTRSDRLIGVFSQNGIATLSQGFLLLSYSLSVDTLEGTIFFKLLFLALFTVASSSLLQLVDFDQLAVNSTLLAVLFFTPSAFNEPIELFTGIFFSVISLTLLLYCIANILTLKSSHSMTTSVHKSGIFITLAVFAQVINSHIVASNTVPDVLTLFVILSLLFSFLRIKEHPTLEITIQYQAIIFSSLLFYNTSLENSLLIFTDIPYRTALQWFYSFTYVGLLVSWYSLSMKRRMKKEVILPISFMNLAITSIMLVTRTIFVDVLVFTLSILLLWIAFSGKTQKIVEVMLPANLLVLLLLPVSPGLTLFGDNVNPYLLLPFVSITIFATRKNDVQKNHITDMLLAAYAIYYFMIIITSAKQPYIPFEVFGLITIFSPAIAVERYRDLNIKTKAIYFSIPFSYFGSVSHPQVMGRLRHFEPTFSHWLTGQTMLTSMFIVFLSYTFVTFIALYFSNDETSTLFEAIHLQFLGLFVLLTGLLFAGNFILTPDLAILLVLITTVGTYRQFARPNHRLLIVFETITLVLALVIVSGSQILLIAILLFAIWASARTYWWYLRGDDSTLLFLHSVYLLGIGVLTAFSSSSDILSLVTVLFFLALIQFGLTGLMISKRASLSNISFILYGFFVASQIVTRLLSWVGLKSVVQMTLGIESDALIFLLDLLFFLPLLLHTRFYLRSKLRYLDQPTLDPKKNPDLPVLSYITGLFLVSLVFGLGNIGILKLLLVVLVFWTFEATIRTKTLSLVATLLTIIIPHVTIIELFGTGLFQENMGIYTLFLIFLGFGLIFLAVMNETKYYGEPLTSSLSLSGLLFGFIAGAFTIVANDRISLPLFPSGSANYFSGIIWSILAIYSFRVGLKHRKLYLRRGSIAILSISVLKALVDLQGLANAILPAILSFIVTGTLSIIMLYWISQKQQ